MGPVSGSLDREEGRGVFFSPLPSDDRLVPFRSGYYGGCSFSHLSRGRRNRDFTRHLLCPYTSLDPKPRL